MVAAELESALAALEHMNGSALRERWARVVGTPCPPLRPRLLRLALAWELQARVHGGMPRGLTQRLDQLAGGRTRTAAIRQGMRLVREWQGELHQVEVASDGWVLWNGTSWRSLSEVARAITGTRWSGPAFFGLRTAATSKVQRTAAA